MSTPTPLAIIGYGCRLPGGVDDGASFWQLLCDGRDAVREVPADRWNAGAFSSARSGIAGKSVSRWGGFLDQIDQFEPECFGISPREAAFIDPQQRLLLETAWEALEHAGVPLEGLAGSRTGVFVGISTADYARLQALPPDLRQLGAFTAQGTSLSIAANRISYCFDLRGPSLIVDTACSSSLVALDCAAKSLREGESNLALVGGVNVTITADTFVSFSAASMLSPDGRSKAFDASAHGFVCAEGAGVVVVKRLDDAVRDGDRIHAVIRAIGVNQDGRTSGMAMPNVNAQEALLRSVYAAARIPPEQIRYVEAHGTGTAIGDPTEAEALGRVFGVNRRADAPLIVGSVKTNIGHLEAAAGIASLLKVVLMLQKRQVPPNLHFNTPNPNIRFDALGLRVPTTLEPWPDEDLAVAGINAFGFGGTNAHAIVCEYQSNGRRHESHHVENLVRSTAKDSEALPFILTARSVDALRLQADSWGRFLEEAEGAQTPLADIAFGAATRRTHHAHRIGFVASGYEEAREQLRAFRAEEPRAGLFVGERRHQQPELAFVFCGQGPQWYGMGRELFDSERVFRDAVEQCDAVFEPVAGWSLIDEMRRDESTSRVYRTSVAQPALFALQVGLARLWTSWGITPSAVVGHSVGELAAAHIAGALPLESAVRLIAHRGQCLEDRALPGRMLAVAISESDARDLLEDVGGGVSISAVNSPEMLTVGGEAAVIERLADRLSQRGIWCRPLKVGHAFHTPLVEPAREPFLHGLEPINGMALQCEMISTVTGQRVNGQPLDPAYWWQNIRQTVRFGDAIKELRQSGIESFLEIGPHPVLTAAIKQCRSLGAPPATVWPSLERASSERKTMRSSLVALFTAGMKVDWPALWAAPRARVELPRHPWIRQRYWHECEGSRRARLDPDDHPLLGQRVAGAESRWQVTIDCDELSWLKDHRIAGQTVFPAAAFVEMALAAAMRTLGTDTCTLDDVHIERALVLQEGAAPDVQVSVDRSSFALTISSRVAESEDAWVKHAEATCRVSTAGDTARIDAVAWQQQPTSQLPGSALYDIYRTLGMEFGPAFQGVVEVTRRDGIALGRLALPPAATNAEACIIHPALLDSSFQVLLETLPTDARSTESVYLPERIDRIRCCRPVGRNAWSEVRLRAASPSAITGDIRIFNDTGELAFEIAGFRCRSMPRPRHRATSPIEECFYRTRWHHQPLPPGSLREPLVLKGGTHSLVRSADAAVRHLWHDRAPRNIGESLAGADRLALAFAIRAMRSFALGLSAPGDGRGRRPSREKSVLDVDALVTSGALAEHSREQFSQCMEALVRAGYAEPLPVRSSAGRWRLIPGVPGEDIDRVWQEIFAQHPDRYPFYRLVEICGSRLAEVWAGRLDPTEVVFSREVIDLLDQTYHDDQWCRYANAVIRHVVVEAIARQPVHRPVRILEVGAGTGGTTSAILSALPSERTEYFFTDTSQFFLTRAEGIYRQFGFVKYQRLDIERPFDEQGVELGSFDVVIAADVLHTTRDLRGAVARCRTALVDGGLLIARELAHSRLSFDLVFGMSEPWWKHRVDPARPNGPLLTTSEWSALLQREGFERPAVPPAVSDDATFATLVVARRPYRPSTNPVPAAVLRTDATPPEPNWIVFADKQGHARLLASRLRARGLRCLEISAGEQFEQAGIDSYRVDLNRAHDREQLAALCHREFTVAFAAVHMWSLDAGTPAAPEHDIAESLACHSVVQMLQALAASAGHAPRRIMLVTRGAWHDERPSHATLLSASLVGLGRVTANEFVTLGIRMVDVDPNDPQPVEAIETEIVSDCADEEVRWRAGYRFVPRLESTSDLRRRATRAGDRRSDAFQIAFTRSGDLESLELRQTTPRAPRRGEVEVDVHFAALNFRDVLKALGRYPADDPRQLQLGDECAGIIRRVGKGVDHLETGDRVVVCQPGTFHSRLTVPAHRAVRIPDNLSLQAAVSMPVAFLTADYALRQVGRLSARDTVLIHSGAGGVGLAAVQIARRVGARIFATAGSPAKRDFLKRLGVERVMDSRSLAFFDEIMDATDGRGVDVVLNSLAGQAMTRSLACLAPGGRFLELGKRDFYENTQIGLWPFRRNVSYHAIDLAASADLAVSPDATSGVAGAAGGSSHASVEALRTLMDLAASGELSPLPIRVMPADQASQAFRLMGQGAHLGKIVLDLTQQSCGMTRDAPPIRLRADATYLVTGAFGGVGLMLARWLIDRGARHLALVSRQGVQSEATRQLVEQWRDGGVDVRDISGDVTDIDHVARVLGEIDDHMAPLAGVFHLASAIDDGVILNLDADRFRRSMAPKVTGAWNLHTLTCNRRLDHFVLFSSLSATVGSPGQAGYAAANAALERLAALRRATGLPGTAIAWGMLGDVGYVAERPRLAEMLLQLGFQPIGPDEVCKALEIAIHSDHPVSVVGRMDWQRLTRKCAGQERTNLLSMLCSKDEDIRTTEGAVRAGEAIRAASPQDRPAMVADYVRNAAARVLGMAPDKVSIDRPLTEFGLDSLMAVELASQIETGIGVAFPMNALGRDITIAKIADVLSGSLGGASGVAVRPSPAVEATTFSRCVVHFAGPTNGRPVFCFHPAGGEVNGYLSLAESLSNECRLIGIQSRLMTGAADEFGSIGEMASAYVDLVRQHDPDGPYQLLGFSFGGLLALHSARILQDQGAPVAWVALAETDVRWSTGRENQTRVAQFLVELYDQMRRELQLVKEVPVETLRRDMLAIVDTLFSVPPSKASSVLANWLSTSGHLRDEAPRGLAEQYLARVTTHLRLLPSTPSCPRVNVPLYVWRASNGLIADETTWDAVTQAPVRVRTVIGNHFDVMTPPHSQSIARDLAALLAPDAVHPASRGGSSS